MMIRSATALRNDYDGMVKLSIEKQEPIFLTRNGDGEMVFLPIELWEKRQAELDKEQVRIAETVHSREKKLLELFAEMLRREQNRFAGARTYSAADMQAETEELLRES